jgi:hypothetical protein
MSGVFYCWRMTAIGRELPVAMLFFWWFERLVTAKAAVQHGKFKILI